MKKKIACSILWLLEILVVTCLGVFLAFQLPSEPDAWIINQLSTGEAEVRDSTFYDKTLSNVQL